MAAVLTLHAHPTARPRLDPEQASRSLVAAWIAATGLSDANLAAAMRRRARLAWVTESVVECWRTGAAHPGLVESLVLIEMAGRPALDGLADLVAR
jgi:hypothetical protein